MTVFIRPDGMYAKLWNKEEEKWTTVPIKEKLTPYWIHYAQVEGATLGDLLLALSRFPENQIQVLEDVCDASIVPFLQEAIGLISVRDVVEGDSISYLEDVASISYLEIYKYYEVHDNEVHQYLREEFGMTGKTQEGQGFDVGLIPLKYLRHLPLRIYPLVKFDYRKTETEFKFDLTLGEVLTAVFGEIGFHGDPENRERACREVMQTVNELE